MKLQKYKFGEAFKIKKLLSGILSFDLLTKGGIPIGKVSLFYGGPSSGKTTLSLKLLGRFLEEYPEAQGLIVDFENSLSQEWGEKIIGSSSDRVDVVVPAYAEEGLAFLKEVLEKGEYQFIVIDSLANIVSVQEVDADAEQEFMGFSARTINKLLRRILPLIVDNERQGKPITIVLINQVRASIQRGPSYVNTFSLPGGKFQEFLASLIVRTYQRKVDEKDELPMIGNFSFVVEKNKSGGLPKVVGEFTINLATGEIMNDSLFINLVKEYGLLEQEKGKWRFLGEVYSTQKEIKERLRGIDFYKQVIDILMGRFYERVKI